MSKQMNHGASLVVPVQVQALCIGTGDESGTPFALGPMADFSSLPYVDGGTQYNRGPYLNSVVMARSGPFEGQTTLPAGIHIHWALPAGLTHAQQEEAHEGQPGSTRMVYPVVPNRWQVTRIWVKNASTSNPVCQTKSWIVESDRLNTAPVSPLQSLQPTVPVAPDTTGQNYRYIGQAFDSSSWTETQAERFPNLTAVGYGETSFAAFYPNCSSVFGYYDDLMDIVAQINKNNDRLAYCVTGWYSDAEMDPLAPGYSSGDNPFGWTFESSDDEKVYNTLCSGIIENISYDHSNTYLTETNNPLNVAIGPSSQEAIAAMLAHQGESDPATAEIVINALQFGLLSQAGTINGTISNFEELVHSAGFVSKEGGIIWQVRKIPSPGDSYEGEVTLPEPIAQDLNTLNERQAQLDELREELASERRQLFCDWYKYLETEYSTRYVPDYVRARGQEAQDALRRRAEYINSLALQTANEGELYQSIRSLADFIRGLLDDQFELNSDVTAPRYWQPGNPFIVMQGTDIVPVNRTGSGETLNCRISDYLVNKVMISPASGVSGMREYASATMFNSVTQPEASPGTILTDMLNDAGMMAPSLQYLMASVYCSIYYAAYKSSLNFSDVYNVLKESQQGFMAGTPYAFTSYESSARNISQAPDQLLETSWNGTPWLPMMAEYDLNFNPVQYLLPGDRYSKDYILNNFSWDENGIELEYQRTLPQSSESYKGIILLTPGAQVDLAQSIRQYMQQTDNDGEEIQSVLNNVISMPLLSQEFTGLTQMMLMQEQILQMNVADPLANSFAQSFVQMIAQAIDQENVYSPDPQTCFNPVRAGSLSIQGIRLVDAFGRFKDNDTIQHTYIARGLQPTSQESLPAGTIFLPPRISQASRLLFRWRSANYDTIEANSHPASSPIIGWVVPDFGDNSLYLYNASGTPLGEMAVSADNTRVIWTPAPGGVFPPGTDMLTVMQNQLPWLRNFATGVYNGGNPSFIAAMLQSAQMKSVMNKTSTSAAGVLAGQPLALVRASLELDLAGSPAQSQSWEAFAASLVPGADEDDAGFTDVKFPVKLGAPNDFTDGLFGYWLERDGFINFTDFYVPGTTTNVAGVTNPSIETLTLSIGQASVRSRTVMMLIDPSAEIHATTGILPVKSITVPSDQYVDALHSLSFTMLTAPVLSGSNSSSLDIPLPKTESGKWSWVTTDNGAWQSQDFSDTVQNSSDAALDYTPQQILEGWLRLRDFEQ